ncbi:hypothetical protein ZMO01_01060 [Zymomonas mobilis subsp. mobilis]|nr:hypothetical protein ZMO01_01060 [Zymomonas mobilis subsp. mobilis]
MPSITIAKAVRIPLTQSQARLCPIIFVRKGIGQRSITGAHNHFRLYINKVRAKADIDFLSIPASDNLCVKVAASKVYGIPLAIPRKNAARDAFSK